MNITAYFSSLGTPKTGLSPTINIRDISDGSLTVSAAAMTEVGDGFYAYAFTAYDPTKDYSIRCDGGATLIDADRYVIAATGIPADGSGFTALGDARIANLDAAVSGRAPSGEYDTEMGRIDATVSSRSTLTAAGVWNALLTGITTAASVGKLIKDYLDAAISTRTKPADTQAAVTTVATVTNDVGITQAAADKVWGTTARSLTTFGTLVADIATAVWGAAARTLTAFGLTVARVTLVDTVTENTDMRGTDEAGTNVIATGKTDADGVATFYMDEGTIYVWRQKSGYNFTNPDTEEVTA